MDQTVKRKRVNHIAKAYYCYILKVHLIMHVYVKNWKLNVVSVSKCKFYDIEKSKCHKPYHRLSLGAIYLSEEPVTFLQNHDIV